MTRDRIFSSLTDSTSQQRRLPITLPGPRSVQYKAVLLYPREDKTLIIVLPSKCLKMAPTNSDSWPHMSSYSNRTNNSSVLHYWSWGRIMKYNAQLLTTRYLMVSLRRDHSFHSYMGYIKERKHYKWIEHLSHTQKQSEDQIPDPWSVTLMADDNPSSPCSLSFLLWRDP